MNADERTLLTRFLQDLVQARGAAKDPEADAMIHQALGANPDAAYVLVQHAIVADQSLHAAQARIAELEGQLRNVQAAQPAYGQPSPGFLPQQPSPWGAAQQGVQYAPPPVNERPGFFSGGSGLGSFLRNAGTTAAGVAGGELLFSGLLDLFGGGHRGGGFGGGDYDRPENVTINNYNDSDDDNDDDSGDYDDSSDDN